MVSQSAISGLPSEISEDESLTRKFRLEETLGIGGMGIVVAARHLELDQRVAIKFLLPEAARSATALARFRREARAAARIDNEHVVRVIDVATTAAAIPYIVMECLEGRDLERVLLRYGGAKFPIAHAVDIILQASEALAEGHRIGIIHRDLKPANLFCVDRPDGTMIVKLLDFGISKIRALTSDLEKTDRHEILGSPRYMSPEQIDASTDVDLRSDIWSLGVILYEMIAGQVPFSNETLSELWYCIRHQSPKPVEQLRRDAPAGLARVVNKCLEKDRGQRYAHLGELATALAPFAAKHSHGSIARIRRTIERQTASTQRSVVPPPIGQDLAAHVSLRLQSPPRARTVVAVMVAGSVIVLGTGAVRLFNHRAAHRGPTESNEPSTVAGAHQPLPLALSVSASGPGRPVPAPPTSTGPDGDKRLPGDKQPRGHDGTSGRGSRKPTVKPSASAQDTDISGKPTAGPPDAKPEEPVATASASSSDGRWLVPPVVVRRKPKPDAGAP